MPCSVDWAFSQMERVVRDGAFWLYAKQELSNPEDDSLALFKGQPVGSAKIYAFWVQKASLKFDIVYFVYYGYNRRKNVLGTVYGNHVSDWEHLTIRVNGALEAEVYLSAQSVVIRAAGGRRAIQ